MALKELGEPLRQFPGTRYQIMQLARLAARGRRIVRAESRYAQRLIRAAEDLGTVKPPEGYVFVSRVGFQSRLSAWERDTDGATIWAPCNVACNGLIISHRLRAADSPVVDLPHDQSNLWEFGTVTARVARFAPERPNYTMQTGLRLHLGPHALMNVGLLPVHEIGVHQNLLHPAAAQMAVPEQALAA